MKIFIAYWKNIFNYKGRSSKKEFLLVIVFNIFIAVILGVLGGILSELLGNKLFIRLPNVYSLLSILPTIAMLKRIFNMYKSGGAKWKKQTKRLKSSPSLHPKMEKKTYGWKITTKSKINNELSSLPFKAECLYVVEVFQKIAERRNIMLKLIKKKWFLNWNLKGVLKNEKLWVCRN